MIRPWFLLLGQATDRRKVEELFLSAARRLSAMTGDAIPRGALTRDLFAAYAIEEYFYNESPDGGMSYFHPEYGGLVPEIDLTVPAGEFLNFELGWSLQATSVIPERESDDPLDEDYVAAENIMLAGWPVVGGTALWAGESCLMMTSELQDAVSGGSPGTPIPGATVPEDSVVPLGAVCYGQAPAGRNPVGVILAGIGRWKITKAQIILRAVYR